MGIMPAMENICESTLPGLCLEQQTCIGCILLYTVAIAKTKPALEYLLS